MSYKQHTGHFPAEATPSDDWTARCSLRIASIRTEIKSEIFFDN